MYSKFSTDPSVSEISVFFPLLEEAAEKYIPGGDKMTEEQRG